MSKPYTKKRFHLVPAVYLFFIKDNKALLLKRKNTGYKDGFYSVPAGHLDGGETVTEAAIREAKEEVDVDIEKQDMQFAHVMHRVDPDVPYIADNETIHERVDFFLVVKKWAGELKNAEPDKCEEIKWCDLDNLPAEVIPYIKDALRAVDKKDYYSEFGWK